MFPLLGRLLRSARSSVAGSTRNSALASSHGKAAARRRFFTPLGVEWLERREVLSGVVSVMTVTSPVNEGSQAGFRIQGSGLPSGGVTVTYQTTPGTATDGADYTGLSGSVFLSPMSPQVVVNVTTLSDTVNDPNETFGLTLTGVTGGASIGGGFASVTLSQPSQPYPGPAPQWMTLSGPGSVNEGQGFT